MPCDRGGGERVWEGFSRSARGGQQQQAGDFVLFALAAFEYTQTQLARISGLQGAGNSAAEQEQTESRNGGSEEPSPTLHVVSVKHAFIHHWLLFRGLANAYPWTKILASLFGLFLFFLSLLSSHAAMLVDKVVPAVPGQYGRRKGGKRKG